MSRGAPVASVREVIHSIKTFSSYIINYTRSKTMILKLSHDFSFSVDVHNNYACVPSSFWYLRSHVEILGYVIYFSFRLLWPAIVVASRNVLDKNNFANTLKYENFNFKII